jgi:hypothetical protein
VTEVRVELEVEFGARQLLRMHTQVVQPEPAAQSPILRLREDTAPTMLLPEDADSPFSQFVPTWFARSRYETRLLTV